MFGGCRPPSSIPPAPSVTVAASLSIPRVLERATSLLSKRTSWLCQALWREGRKPPGTRTQLRQGPRGVSSRREGRLGTCISNRRTQMLLMTGKVGETTRYTLSWVPCLTYVGKETRANPATYTPKQHIKDVLPASPGFSLRPEVSVWRGGHRPGDARPGAGPPFRPATRVARAPGEPGSEQPSHHFQPQPGKLDRAAACALGSRTPGAPRPHHPGAGMCALRAPAPPPSHVCAAGARGRRGARHRAAPSPLPPSPHHPREWASAGSGRDPGGGPPSGL